MGNFQANECCHCLGSASQWTASLLPYYAAAPHLLRHRLAPMFIPVHVGAVAEERGPDLSEYYAMDRKSLS